MMANSCSKDRRKIPRDRAERRGGLALGRDEASERRGWRLAEKLVALQKEILEGEIMNWIVQVNELAGELVYELDRDASGMQSY